MTVGKYSIYFDAPYPANFGKLYKGVIVVVDNDMSDTKHMHFAIRTKKKEETIYKTRNEELHNIIFNDIDHTITCGFSHNENNNSASCVAYKPDVYDELKNMIPGFMIQCGCAFNITDSETGIELEF